MTENYYGKTALAELNETELDGASTYISVINKTDETFTVLLGWGVNKNESTRKKIEPGATVDLSCYGMAAWFEVYVENGDGQQAQKGMVARGKKLAIMNYDDQIVLAEI